jgi:hypothetical protein
MTRRGDIIVNRPSSLSSAPEAYRMFNDTTDDSTTVALEPRL